MSPFTGLRIFYAFFGVVAFILMLLFMFAPTLYTDVNARLSGVRETREHRVIGFRCSDLWIMSYCGLRTDHISRFTDNHDFQYLILADIKDTEPALLESASGDVITSDIAQNYLLNRLMVFVAIFSVLVLIAIRLIKFIFS